MRTIHLQVRSKLNAWIVVRDGCHGTEAVTDFRRAGKIKVDNTRVDESTIQPSQRVLTMKRLKVRVLQNTLLKKKNSYWPEDLIQRLQEAPWGAKCNRRTHHSKPIPKIKNRKTETSDPKQGEIRKIPIYPTHPHRAPEGPVGA